MQFRPLAKSETKTELLVKLFVFTSFYGGLVVNWIDLFGSPKMPGYHLWLAIIYFSPFLVILVLKGLEDWELAISYGLTSSLLNDLLYYVVGRYLFGFRVDLLEWCRCQLLPVCDKPVYFDFLLFRVKPYPHLMPLSIYARAIAVYVLLYKWWRE
jgi:hypothetical protein